MTLRSDQSIFASGVVSLLIKVFGAILSYAMIVAFAHLLSADDYGRFALGLNGAIIIAALVGWGFNTGVMRYWPQQVVAHNPALAKGTVELGYLITFLSSALLLILAVVLSSSLSSAFDVGSRGYVITVFFLGGMIAFADFSTNLLRAQGSILASMLPRDVFWRLATPAIAYVLSRQAVALDSTLSLVISAFVLAVLNIWQGTWIRFNVSAFAGSIKAKRDFRSLIPSLLPLWAAAVVYAMIQQFDVVIVGSLLSKADAGSYFAAQKTAQLLSLVLIAGGLATAPHMSALYHAGKFGELQSLCRKLAIAIAGVTLAGFVFLIFAGKLLLSFFDPQFVAAYPVLIAIALGTVVDAVAGPNAYLMQMTKFEGAYLKTLVICYALVIVAQLMLIPRYGSLGAALASACGIVTWNFLAIYILRRKAGLDPSLLAIIMPPRHANKI